MKKLLVSIIAVLTIAGFSAFANTVTIKNNTGGPLNFGSTIELNIVNQNNIPVKSSNPLNGLVLKAGQSFNCSTQDLQELNNKGENLEVNYEGTYADLELGFSNVNQKMLDVYEISHNNAGLQNGLPYFQTAYNYENQSAQINLTTGSSFDQDSMNMQSMA